MSTAFILMMIWLGLTGLNSFAPADWRRRASLALFAMAPLLVLFALATQGWLPGLFAAGIAVTVYPAHLADLVRIVRSGGVGPALAHARRQIARRLPGDDLALRDHREDRRAHGDVA